MRLNSKLSWGLAWAGLAVVVAVPSADYLTSQPQTAAVITTDTQPVETASITPAVALPEVATPAETTPRTILPTLPATPGATLAPTPVKVAIAEPEPVTPAPALAVTPAETANPSETKVASISPTPRTPPFPTPVSQRPTMQTAPADDSIYIPSDVATAEPPPMSGPMMLEPEGQDDIMVMPSDTTTTGSTRPRPPGGLDDDPNVSDPESLRDYLIQRGLFEEDSGVDVGIYADGEYDPDGFYLDEEPQASSGTVRRQRLDTVPTRRAPLLEFSLF